VNLKRIAGMCKARGAFSLTNIVNEDGQVIDQWVHLGGAMYRIGDMGLTAYTLARMAGVKEQDTEKYIIEDKSSEQLDWMRDYPKSREDQDAAKATVGLLIGSREIQFYRTREELLPINTEYLAPLDTEQNCYIRLMGDEPVLAVKEGMYIAAVIGPYDVFGEKDGIKLPELKRAFEAEKNIWR